MQAELFVKGLWPVTIPRNALGYAQNRQQMKSRIKSVEVLIHMSCILVATNAPLSGAPYWVMSLSGSHSQGSRHV